MNEERSGITLQAQSPFEEMKVVYGATQDLAAPDGMKSASHQSGMSKVNVRIQFEIEKDEGYELLGIEYAEASADGWTVIAADSPQISGMVRIPEGIYTFVGIFKAIEPGVPQKIIIKEEVDVSQTPKISFDSSDATEMISFRGILPNGEPIKTPLLSENFQILEEGNIYTSTGFTSSFFGYYSNHIVHRQYGPAFNVANYTYKQEIDGRAVDYEQTGYFLVNKNISDDFNLFQYQVQCLPDKETSVVLTSMRKGMEAGNVENETTNYHSLLIDELYTTEGFCTGEEIAKKMNDVGLIFLERGNIYGYIFMTNPGGAEAKGLEACIIPENEMMDFTLAMTPIWNTKPVMSGMAIAFDSFQLNAPLQRILDGEPTTIVTPILNSGYYGSFLFVKDDMFDSSMALTGNPAFSFQNSKSHQLAGDNCPFIFLHDMSTADYFDFTQKTWGRIGESPTLPIAYPEEITIKYGDTEWNNLKTGEDDLNLSDILAQFQEVYKEYKGTLDLEIKQYKQIIVDGIPSKAAVAARWDFASEDPAPPVLTMIQFRNTDDIVTDRFDTPEDGVITMSAGDFKYIQKIVYDNFGNPISEYGYDKYLSTPEATVEYSPLGQEKWQEIDVEEDKEKFYMPCYGAYFCGSLKGVKDPSPTGWFDLRVSLKDGSGNTQVNTISPAFKIKSLSGFKDVEVEETIIFSNGKINYSGEGLMQMSLCTLEGVDLIHTSQQELDVTGLAKGVYILTVETREKTYSKKIYL